jgi:hypothetical protein
MAGPEEERDFRLGWSLWRRAHQAVAKRCHTAKRDLLRARVPDDVQPELATTAMPLLAPMSSRLTDAQWTRIEALLSQNNEARGRRWRDHRTVIEGMLWVHASGASWRDLPEEEFGPWQTIYDRYNRWRKEGLWQQIVEVLRCQR